MEIKVGIQHVSREIVVETTESAADIEKSLEKALGGDGFFTVTDERGRKVLIPASKIAYVASARRTPATWASGVFSRSPSGS